MKTRYFIYATAINKHGTTISKGKNSYTKSHPLQAYFAKKVGRPEQIYLHAEIQCILNAKGDEIYELKIERDDRKSLRNAKPCPICMEAIRAFGIKKITYTTDTGYKTVWVNDGNADKL